MTNSFCSLFCYLGYRNRRLRMAWQVLPLVLFAALFCCNPPATAQSKELHIAAAADLQPVLPALAAEYEKQTGVHIIASFGSSATLTQQLQNGDPQDLFLSADFTHPEQLVAGGLAYGLTRADDPTQYATGALVLWARNDSPAQPLTLESLSKPVVTRIAIANPLHAPYGLAAQRAIEALHLTDTLKPKLVVAENIGQTAQFVETGNAQAGFISLTSANTKHFRDLGTFVRVPAVYPKLIQCAVILKSSSRQPEARDFLRWLTSTEVQKQLPGFGLDPAQ